MLRRRTWAYPLVGFVVGLMLTTVLSALTVFLAVSRETTVRFRGVAETVYTAIDEVEFVLDFQIQALGYVFPVLGLVLGAIAQVLLGRLSSRRETT